MSTAGCHLTVCVYYIESRVLYYRVSCTWDIQDELPNLLGKCFKRVGLLDDTPISVKSMHTLNASSDSINGHKCSRKCWSYSPLQKDGNSCGVSTNLIMCLAVLSCLLKLLRLLKLNVLGSAT